MYDVSLRTSLLLAPVLTALGAATLAQDAAHDWPQWRGPARDALSPETAWTSEGRAEDLWSADVGLGYSSVAVVGGRLYTAGHDAEAGLDVIWCLDARTGEELWAHTYPARIWNEFHGGGTLSTPTVGGDAVFTLNREGRLHCLDAATGEVRWHRELIEELELSVPRWGFAASPLLADGTLYVNVGRVLALTPATGETRWTSEADYGHAYSTPTAYELDGAPRLAIFNGDGLVLLDRTNGKTLARHPFKTQYDINAASPIVFGERVFISAGYEHGCALLDLSGDGLEVLWENKRMRNQMSGSVLVDGHLFGFDEAVLTCMGLDGEVRWRERGLGEGALIATADRLIVLGGDGELVIAEATPEAFRPLARAQVLAEGPCWTRPVLAGGLIYCRSSKGTLVCRDHRGEG